MKRLYILFTSVITILCMFTFNSVYASEKFIGYDNVITDETTIEEDFEVIGLDITNYCKPDSINNAFERSYIVGYSESILEDNIIQSYIYIYYSYKLGNDFKITNMDLSYSLIENGAKTSYKNGVPLITSQNCLVKVKAFTYYYIKDVNISVSLNEVQFEDSTGELIYNYDVDTTDFCCDVSHSLIKDNVPFACEFKYNSVLIIDEMQLVRIDVQPDLWETCSFSSWWNTFFDLQNKELWLHFYNFNFPDNIEVDSIEYAKFEYDYVKYFREYDESIFEIKEIITEEERQHKFKSYNSGSKEFETYNNSGVLEFETFTLGNRIEKGEFPSYCNFTDETKKLFDYDCSVLLDCSVRKHNGPCSTLLYEESYNQLENVDFLELHYRKDGVLYECQVISEIVGDEEDDKEVVGEDNKFTEFPLFDEDGFILKMLNAIKEWFTNLWETNKNSVIVIIVLIVIVICLFTLFPHIISWIFKAIISLLKMILKGIVWLIKLPFKLIKWLFSGFKR